MYDYYVVSDCLIPAVHSFRVYSGPFRPHLMAMLELAKDPRCCLAYRLLTRARRLPELTAVQQGFSVDRGAIERQHAGAKLILPKEALCRMSLKASGHGFVKAHLTTQWRWSWTMGNL